MFFVCIQSLTAGETNHSDSIRIIVCSVFITKRRASALQWLHKLLHLVTQIIVYKTPALSLNIYTHPNPSFSHAHQFKNNNNNKSLHIISLSKDGKHDYLNFMGGNEHCSDTRGPYQKHLQLRLKMYA